MDYKYVVVHNKYDDEIASRESFGVACVQVNGKEFVVIKTISDITQSRTAIENLVDLCNRFELSIVHLKDVVEDFLL